MTSLLEVLHQISKIVSSGLELDEMLRELVHLAVEVTNCDACLIYLAEPDGEVVLRASQLPHTAEIGNIRIKPGEGVTGWVAEHRAVVEQMGGAISKSRLTEENARLQEETLEMKRQLETRKLVERAKGILQSKYKLSEESAYLRLRNESRRLRRPMRDLAEAIILAEDVVSSSESTAE